MKKLLLLITVLLVISNGFSQGGSCASPAALTSGSCSTLTSQTTFTDSGPGNCGETADGAIWIEFTTGSSGQCPQITVTPNFNCTADQIGYRLYSSGCSTSFNVDPGPNPPGSPNATSSKRECLGNIVAGEPFTLSGITFNGSYQLDPNTNYHMVIYSSCFTGANSLQFCYNANTPEAAANECSGSTGLGGGTQSFFNGGDCSYSGDYDDAGANDPTPSDICAGSLENTQWVVFAPAAGATSFSITGSNVVCTGGGCGFQFGIFSGSCGSLTPEGCFGERNTAPAGCSGGQSGAGPTNVSGGLANIAWSGTSSSGFTATFTPVSPATSFTGTERFYLVMDGNADSDCNYDLTGVNITPLSNEQGTLKAVKRNGNNVLMWGAVGQNGQSEFILQRSKDGVNWANIFIAPVKNLIDVVNYNYTDASYGSGASYYRVVGDFDGQMKVITKTVALNENSDKTVVRLLAYDVFGRLINPGENPTGLIIYVTEYEDGTFETRKEYKGN